MAEAGERQEGLIRRVRITAIVGLVSALLALATGGVTLLFDLKPEWKPDPKEKVGASISVTALDENVTQGQYLHRIFAPQQYRARVRGCTRDQLNRKGNVVYIHAKIEGFKRGKTGLRWFTYDANNSTREPYLRSSAKESTIFKPQAPISDQIAQVWVQSPLPQRGSGRYFVRFELYNAGTLLAFVDTRPFDVAVSPFEPHGLPCRLR